MTSTLDPDTFSNREPPRPKGHDIRSLGPSDSSDSGSDIASAPTADDDFPLADEEPGSVERDDDSDQAEEAQLGINDDDNRKSRRSARDSRPG